MLERIENRGDVPYEEVLFEAAAVLAGTMLMGAGVSGNRPDAHDSSVTLATLVQQIAVVSRRLLREAAGAGCRVRTPSGCGPRRWRCGSRWAARGSTSTSTWPRRRAEQLQHVHLAQLFARMGYTEAAARQVRVVPVASARMKCDIHCRLTDGAAADRGGRSWRPRRPAAARRQRGRGPAAPGHRVRGPGRSLEHPRFRRPVQPLSLPGEQRLRPPRRRADRPGRRDLRRLRADREGGGRRRRRRRAGRHVAAAGGPGRLVGQVRHAPRSARSRASPAARPASRPTTWPRPCGPGTRRARPPATWPSGASHAEQFRSPKAYALVVDALLEHRDPVAAMALLVQWLSQAEEIPLVEENYSFHALALDWMDGVVGGGADARPAGRRRRGAGPLGPGAEVPRLSRSQRRAVLAGAAVRAGRRRRPQPRTTPRNRADERRTTCSAPPTRT